MDRNLITIKPVKMTRVLAVAAVALVLASLLGQIWVHLAGHEAGRLVTLFDLSRERNIPTFFTVCLMLVIALLLSVPSVLNARGRGPHASKWRVLALGFLCMAYDEAFQVHELFIEPVRSLLGQESLGLLYYAWVLPALALVAVLGLYFLKFLRDLPARSRRTFLLAAGLYLGGGLGIELIGGGYDELHGYDNLTYNLISTAEESLEIVGLLVFIHGLLTYLGREQGDLRLRVETPET